MQSCNVHMYSSAPLDFYPFSTSITGIFCWLPLRLRLLKVWITQNQRAMQNKKNRHRRAAGNPGKEKPPAEGQQKKWPHQQQLPGRDHHCSPWRSFVGLGQLGSHSLILFFFFRNCAYATSTLLILGGKEGLRRRRFLCRFISRLWSLQTCAS